MATRRVVYGKVPTTDEEELGYGMAHHVPAAASIDDDHPDSAALNEQLTAISNQNKFMRRAVIVAVALILIVVFSSSEQASLFASAVIKSLNTTTSASSASSVSSSGDSSTLVTQPATSDIGTNDPASAVLVTVATTTSAAPVTAAPIATIAVAATVAPAPIPAATATPPISDKVEQCTPDQLKKIEQQLPTNPSCFSHQWDQACPITQATNVPEPNWLFDYYNTKIPPEDISTPFVAIDVGCGKATRALLTLKMGTRDSAIVDIPTWIKAVEEAPQPTPDVDLMVKMLAPITATTTKRAGTIHCIEPMPITYEAVKKASESTKVNQMGFVLHQVAIADKEGTQDFPIVDVGPNYHHKVSVGAKEVGVHSCAGLTDADKKQKCKTVQGMTLDSFVNKNIPNTNQNSNKINVLLVYANAFEYEVLVGAKSALSRVEYLEFAFNHKNGWANPDHTLTAAADMLNDIGFTCFWAGKKKLWRITGCSLPHYSTVKSWANVACANRKLAPVLAAEMEKAFLQTIN
jgi:FkbM family methyltransferase